jgi:hypothetical protein
MKFIKEYKVFENKKVKEKSKRVLDFEKKYELELDEKFNAQELDILEKAFSFFKVNFIKGKIDKIVLEKLGGVHGRWKDTPKKKQMTLNPSIFKFKKEFKDGIKDIPYKVFVIVHEIGHCVDHLDKVSFSKKWQAISGWKKCDRDKKIPEGYKRYIEKRKGRELAGPKKSNWVHKEDADFCRNYSSRNPREDFADSFAFAVFKDNEKFKTEGTKEKLAIIKDILNEIE